MADFPSDWRGRICEITGLHFCDRTQLWWWPVYRTVPAVPDWVPDWMNGADRFEIWRWLVANGKADECPTTRTIP